MDLLGKLRSNKILRQLRLVFDDVLLVLSLLVKGLSKVHNELVIARVVH